MSKSRTKVVFGEGSSSGVVFVGECPGPREDETGRPFIGRAGALLTHSIESCLGMRRDEVYMCNVIKCRPPKSRAPEEDEVEKCFPFLRRQLQIINPKIIVTLGNTPLKALTGLQGITKLRGSWYTWEGHKVMPTYHPAYLLRSPKAIQQFEQDLTKVLNKLRTL